MKQSRIPSRYEHCEFDSYHPELGGPGREKRDQALATAKKFVQEYPLEKTGLILIGPIGTGKTHLAVSILRELILRKGIPGLFYDYRELLKQVQNSYNASVQVTEMDVLRPVFETEVLDRKSTRLNSSHLVISYAVFCLKKKTNNRHTPTPSSRNTPITTAD